LALGSERFVEEIEALTPKKVEGREAGPASWMMKKSICLIRILPPFIY